MIERARDLDHPQTEAKALYQLGQIRAEAGDFRGARQALEGAVRIAEEAGYDEITARGWVALAGLEAAAHGTRKAQSDRPGARLVQPTEVSETESSHRGPDREVLRRARAALERYDRDPALVAELTMISGKLSARDRAYEQALGDLEKAFASYRAAKKPLRAAEVLADMSGVYSAQSEIERALEMAERAERALRDELGPQHPAVIERVGQIAGLLRAKGDFDGARERDRQVAEFRRAVRERAIATTGISGAGTRRAIAGRVLGPDGKPVRGAEVAIASRLQGDAKYLVLASRGGPGQLHAAVARTDEGGAFTVSVVGDALYAVAEKPGLGRSIPVAIAIEPDRGASEPSAGSPSVSPSISIDLQLQAFGALKGQIDIPVDVAHGRAVTVVPIDGDRETPLALRARLGSDGRYAFEQLAAGTYAITIGPHRRRVVVRPGEVTELVWKPSADRIPGR